jgi:hypothetical protein
MNTKALAQIEKEMAALNAKMALKVKAEEEYLGNMRTINAGIGLHMSRINMALEMFRTSEDAP